VSDKYLQARVPAEVHAWLRRTAFDEDTSIAALLAEAVSLLREARAAREGVAS
jgi:hypothetical protein